MLIYIRNYGIILVGRNNFGILYKHVFGLLWEIDEIKVLNANFELRRHHS